MTNKEFTSFYYEYLTVQKKLQTNIDITYRCPLQCPFCHRQENDYHLMREVSEDISLDDFIKIIKFSDVKINMCGQASDPIYHPNFLELLREACKYPNKEFSISTNGTRKSTDWWKQVFAISGSNIHWKFGLDGTDQETANIYRINTNFDEVWNVMMLGLSMNVDIVWQFIVFQHNEHQIELAKSMAKQNGLNLQIIKSDRWPQEYIDKYKIYPPSDEWKTEPKTKKRNIFIRNIT